MLYFVSMDLDPIFSHPIHENTSPGQGTSPCSGGHVTSPPLAAHIKGAGTALRNHFIDPEYAFRAFTGAFDHLSGLCRARDEGIFPWYIFENFIEVYVSS